MMQRRVLVQAAAAAAVGALAPLAARAQAWPAKPIRWVVAYPAGGGSDLRMSSSQS